jgi:MFS family permease
VRAYANVLRHKGFRRLWLGATVSATGDGMTFVALSWLVLSQPGGSARIGLLGVCYTAPVLVGGLLVGPLLDRFDKRAVLALDSLVRAVVVATIPLTAALGTAPGWLPFAVAAVHGLLKMVPLAGFPAAIPQLVPDAALEPANALESMSFSLAFVLGPVTAGLLISTVTAETVLVVDSASFLAFALAAVAVRDPLAPAGRSAARPSLAGLRRDRVIVATTLAFMAFNVAEGMLLVAAPWLAKNHLPGGAAALGVLLSAMAAGELVGAALAGRRRGSLVRAIGVVQAAAAACFLALLAVPSQVVVGLGFFGIGLLSAPMTVWAQSLRMRRVPAELHGRAFSALRTLMQGTPPVGTLLVTPFLAGDQPAAAAIVMALVAGLPALLLVAVRL